MFCLKIKLDPKKGGPEDWVFPGPGKAEYGPRDAVDSKSVLNDDDQSRQ